MTRQRTLSFIRAAPTASACPGPAETSHAPFSRRHTTCGGLGGRRGTRPGEIFHAVRRFILPPDLEHDILDWAHPELPEVADYFAQGMEWWGVFLFTIHVPALNRLTAIAGSTTD